VKFEHAGFQHPDPVAAAKWYVEHLGLKVVRGSDQPPFAHFLADSSGRVVIEMYSNPTAPMPDYRSQNILVFHLAMESDDVRADRDRLVKAGATVEIDVGPQPAAGQDEVVTLHDPWGVPVQMVKRARPLV
jgi:hypothetical protein